MKTPPLEIRCTRVAPPAGICPTELKVLREVFEYQGEREVAGSTLLDAASVGRQAYLLTLADGEHLLLLMHAQRFVYWEASRATIELLHKRATDWLTEPSSNPNPRMRQSQAPWPY
jgi:hypothetical protein